jgi:hypothetical protein
MYKNKEDVGGAHTTHKKKNVNIFSLENLKGKDRGVDEDILKWVFRKSYEQIC